MFAVLRFTASEEILAEIEQVFMQVVDARPSRSHRNRNSSAVTILESDGFENTTLLSSKTREALRLVHSLRLDPRPNMCLDVAVEPEDCRGRLFNEMRFDHEFLASLAEQHVDFMLTVYAGDE